LSEKIQLFPTYEVMLYSARSPGGIGLCWEQPERRGGEQTIKINL
jgi:hypothetical protein